MQQQPLFIKPALGLLWTQLIWTFWALGIIVLVHFGRIFFINMFSSNVGDSFYSAGYISANIYMFIIGIIVISSLPYFVEHGVSRKNYFIGNVIASIVLSILIPIFIYLISMLEKLVISLFTSNVLNDHSSLEEAISEATIDIDGNLLGEVILSFILTPYVHPESNLLLSLALFSLHIFVFYIIGWMIAAAFYRLGVIFGLIFIAIGIVLIGIKDSMVRLALDIPLFQNYSALDIVPEYLALPVVFAVVIVTITIIRLLTKRAPISI